MSILNKQNFLCPPCTKCGTTEPNPDPTFCFQKTVTSKLKKRYRHRYLINIGDGRHVFLFLTCAAGSAWWTTPEFCRSDRVWICCNSTLEDILFWCPPAAILVLCAVAAILLLYAVAANFLLLGAPVAILSY